MVILGLYTGARISDVATFTWENVDLTRAEVRYASRKTGRITILPMAAALREHVEGLRASDNPHDPIHPQAFATVAKENRVGTLSRQFGEIHAAAGLAAPRTHKALPDGAGKGRAGRRNVSEGTYHCLRHTLTSWLKNAGVSDAIARDLVGHESAEISRLYTHVDDAAKRDELSGAVALKRPCGEEEEFPILSSPSPGCFPRTDVPSLVRRPKGLGGFRFANPLDPR